MRNPLDFSSWQGIVTTLVGLVVISLVAVGIRLLDRACSGGASARTGRSMSG
jgi:hypothetical protein